MPIPLYACLFKKIHINNVEAITLNDNTIKSQAVSATFYTILYARTVRMTICNGILM